ncbi:MAG: MutS-related protein [Acutalibacteraceae bacterium]
MSTSRFSLTSATSSPSSSRFPRSPSHTKNIVEILKVCDKDSLVLFDELCAGTDPAEGAALAISIIEFCRKCGAGVAATTHYAELKLYAMRTSGVMNASCEFNVETLQPTYRLLIGVPGKSNAFAISKRLGIDEAILEQARSLVSQNDVNFEDVLTQLDQQRQEMEKAKEEAERLRRETEKQKEKSDEYYAQIKQEKEKAARAGAQGGAVYHRRCPPCRRRGLRRTQAAPEAGEKRRVRPRLQ